MAEIQDNLLSGSRQLEMREADSGYTHFIRPSVKFKFGVHGEFVLHGYALVYTKVAV